MEIHSPIVLTCPRFGKISKTEIWKCSLLYSCLQKQTLPSQFSVFGSLWIKPAPNKRTAHRFLFFQKWKVKRCMAPSGLKVHWSFTGPRPNAALQSVGEARAKVKSDLIWIRPNEFDYFSQASNNFFPLHSLQITIQKHSGGHAQSFGSAPLGLETYLGDYIPENHYYRNNI